MIDISTIDDDVERIEYINNIGNLIRNGEIPPETLNEALANSFAIQRYLNGLSETILAEDGGVTFKTDNVSLFDFSLEEVEAAGWKLLNSTRDLHNSEYNEGNVMTEYEKKFSEMGNPICRLMAVPAEE